MRMTSKSVSKGKPGARDSNSGSEIECESHLSQGGDNDDVHHSVQESDLFSFLSNMHLSGGSNSNSSITSGQIHPAAAAQVLASRKRKFLDQGGGAHLGSGNNSGKLFGAMRPPSHRRNSDEEAPLHTPQCSQSGKVVLTIHL